MEGYVNNQRQVFATPCQSPTGRGRKRGSGRFFASVHRRAKGINTAEAKQKIIVELYDKFFRNAFPKMTERLGIVYTPLEVVDFIIHSVNEVLQSEFGQTLGSKGVHIMDPFNGTGTFVTRLLQSGLIKPEELEHKYRHEIHANEIVLLAYYIAAINIEAANHSAAGGEYPVTIAQGDLRLANIPDPVKYYRVEKMKFGGKRPNTDKTTVIYNANITITGIPLEAYEYVVNGKPALEWVMERQCVKVDKASGIENDANRYANETVGDPAYPLLLFQRVISVSLETMEIVNGLPKLEIG